jgi:hypothetical protein
LFSKKEAMWAVVTLKSGVKVRGKYGLNSFASSYPSERQIYLEEVWTRGENGGFGKKINRTKGVIVAGDEIAHVEFYK